MKKVLLISGPSGVGKGELLKRLKEHYADQLYFAKSVTTREKRAHEKEGIDYYFWTKERFLKAQAENAFLETARIYDNYYGTLKSEVMASSGNASFVVIEADVQGIQALQQQIKDSISIFILPPDLETLKKRLKKRQTESEAEQEKRFKKTKSEIFAVSRYNNLIVNDELSASFDELRLILIKECGNL